MGGAVLAIHVCGKIEAPQKYHSCCFTDLSCSCSAAQYHEFGQDVNRLHENVGQLEKVYQSVQARSTKRVPPGHPFYDASSLNTILEEPFKTIKECWVLLRQRDSFSEERGAIKNIYWNILIEADVAQLHEKVKFHNVKIVTLLKPLEM